MAESSTTPGINETQIWTSYLLPPSPLPTILPYNVFLSLVPATYRNDPEHGPGLKRVYRDLQLQRDITIEQVRDNISRECSQRAASLRGSLTRRIAIEEGDKLAARQDARIALKLKRRQEQTRQQANGDESTSEDAISSDDDEFTNPQTLAAQQAMYNDASNLHPAAHVLPFIDGDVKFHDSKAYHTKPGLLRSMRNLQHEAQAEIERIERECAALKNKISDTIGGLSDLRYGKRQSNVDSGNNYDEILAAIEDVKKVMTWKSAR